MKLQLSSMMMANSIRSCAQAPRQIDRCSTASNHLASPTCSAKSRANNDEQLESIWSSHSVSYFPSLAGVAFRAPNATGLIQVCFSQIFGFLFQNCSVYCLLGRCLALPYPAPPGTAQGLTCLMFFCLPDLYIKYITAFFNFLQLCVPQKTKNASFCRFVSSRLVFVSSGPLAALVSLFYYIPNSDLRFFLQRGYEFLLSSEPQIGFNMKKRRNEETRAQISLASVCVCAPNLVFF